MSAPGPRSGLVTAGETMGLVAQATAGSLRNGEQMTFGIGGSESNVAIGVRRLGVPATWAGRIGADPIGRSDPARAAGRAGGGDRHGRSGAHRHDDPLATDGHARPPELLPARQRRSPPPGGRPPRRGRPARRRVHVTGITLALGAGPSAVVAHAIAVARSAATVVSFDLNYRRALWSPQEAAPALAAAVRKSDVVFAGIEEAGIVVGTTTPPVAAAALAAMGPSQVVIKLGAGGCVARLHGQTFEVPAPPGHGDRYRRRGRRVRRRLSRRARVRARAGRAPGHRRRRRGVRGHGPRRLGGASPPRRVVAAEQR